MGFYLSKSTVIEGAYVNQYVFGLKSNQLQIFTENSFNDWKLNSGKVTPNAVIDKDTVKSITLVQEREKGVDAADVGGATLLLGPIMGAAMYADGKRKLYYVNVVFKDGAKSLLKIESELYDIVQGIAFEVSNNKHSAEKTTSVVNNDSKAHTKDININPDNIEPTITRIELFLEDKEWSKVRAYAEAGLDYFPTDYRLYKYLLLSDMRYQTISELKNCGSYVVANDHYKKLMQFADEPLRNELDTILGDIRKEKIYKEACASNGRTALAKFKTIKGYKDADEKADLLENRISAEETRVKQERQKQEQEQENVRQSNYLAAIELQENAKDPDGYRKALAAFEELKRDISDDNAKRKSDIIIRNKELKEKCNELLAEEYNQLNEKYCETQKELLHLEGHLAAAGLFEVERKKQLKIQIKETKDHLDVLKNKMAELKKQTGIIE